MNIVNTLYDALPSVASTLTELQIHWKYTYSYFPVTISLGRLLRICRKLTSIILDVNEIIDSTCQPFALSHTTSLTHIELHQTVRNLKLLYFESLFRYSPELQHLTMSIASDPDILPILDGWCSKLISVEINKEKFRSFDHEIADITPRKDSIPGKLERLILDGVRTLEPILPLLHESTQSIHSMCLAPADDAWLDWTPLRTFVLPRLTYLHLDCQKSPESFLRDQIPVIIGQCPALEKLVLQNKPQDPQRSVTVPLYQAIAKLSRLSYLRLRYFDISGSMFIQLLAHCASQCSLRELGLIFCENLTGATMQWIARIKSLETLELIAPGLKITAGDTLAFTRLLSTELNRLSTLKLGLMKLTDQDIRSIGQCKNLSRLLLKKVIGLTADGSTMLRGRIQQFEVVQ